MSGDEHIQLYLGREQNLTAPLVTPIASWLCTSMRLAIAVASVLCLVHTPVGARTVGPAFTTPPSIAYEELFRDVQLSAIFPDSKTFPDMIPDASPATIRAEYRAMKAVPGFNLAAFVRDHFTGPVPHREPGPARSAPARLYQQPLADFAGVFRFGAPLRELAAAALSLCRAGRAFSRGLLLGFLFHDARPRR